MTRRQECIRFAQERAINLSGNQGNGICVSGPEDGKWENNWVTVFDKWDDLHAFFMLANQTGDYIKALDTVNAY